MDWRSQIQHNQRRTYWVITIFIGFYLLLGCLIDLYIYSGRYPQVPLEVISQALLTFRLIPTATLITCVIALISLWITYTFYDRIMLLGTEYHEIFPATNNTAEKQLYNVVEELKIAAGLHFMPRVYVIDADYMNAFASGYSEKSAMVAITRGLMQKLNRRELQAVMAHELSHIRHGDIKLTMTASVLSNILLIAVDLLFYNIVFGSNRNGERRADQRLMLLIMILRYVLPLITLLLTLYLSRTREYMADAGCVELTRDNEALANALLKIHQDHQLNAEVYNQLYTQTAHEDVRKAAYLYDPSQAGIRGLQSFATLFSTHPDIRQRLSALGIKLQ